MLYPSVFKHIIETIVTLAQSNDDFCSSGGARVSGARGHRSFWRPFPLLSFLFPPVFLEVGALEVDHLKPI